MSVSVRLKQVAECMDGLAAAQLRGLGSPSPFSLERTRHLP